MAIPSGWSILFGKSVLSLGTLTQKTTSAPFDERIDARASLSTLISSIFFPIRFEISDKTAVEKPAGVPSGKTKSNGGKSPVTATLIVSAPSIFAIGTAGGYASSLSSVMYSFVNFFNVPSAIIALIALSSSFLRMVSPFRNAKQKESCK